jgi:alkaline phosphatase D
LNRYSIGMLDRRRFLQALAAAGVSRALPGCAQGAPRLSSYPFGLGVASGYPHPGGMVLWTRLVGELDPTAVPVRWEIAGDEAMRQIVASGSAPAEAEWAHSVRVEAKGLEPGRWYWYRFMAGDAVSPVGRTRTAPRLDAAVDRLRFAFASCQQYEQGYFGAHRHIAADAPDLVAFLGDYIYESSWGKNHVRKHDVGEPYDLAGYRARYAQYKSDPDLQAAHAACPWIVTWDDHEVDNDYANDRSEDGMPRERFLERRAAAYRAYYEHMPLPARMRPQGPDMRLYTQLGWGTLGRFFLLDDRQYRSWEACPRRGRSGGSNVVDIEYCRELVDPRRTILGRAQERWLERALVESRAGWNLLAQQTRMAQFDQKPGPGRRAWTDGWDGYPMARQRLLEFLAAQRIANPVVLGGDVHLFNVCDLKPDFDDPASPVVASEFVGTSITSQAPSQNRLDRLLPDNPHMKLLDSRFRGYVRMEVTAKSLRADLRAMATVQVRDAACTTLASFEVVDGRAGPQPA